MQAFGLDAIIVHDERSREIYHDYVNPRKFAGALPVLFDNGQGDVIYAVPRRDPDLARVVETARVYSLPQIGPIIADHDALRAYAEALEKGPAARAVTETRRIGWEDIAQAARDEYAKLGRPAPEL